MCVSVFSDKCTCCVQCACSGLVIISCRVVTVVLSCFVNVSSVFALKFVWSLSTVAVIMFYCCSEAGNGQRCVVIINSET